MSEILLRKKLPIGGVIVYNDRPEVEFYQVQQVHGNNVVSPTSELVEADGIFTPQSGSLDRPLVIKTADCLPITLIGHEGVAHLHAGWRGLHEKIHAVSNVMGIEPTYAFIGPAIHWDSYEVGPEFLDHFPELASCFKPSSNEGKHLFNLPLAAKEMLEKTYPDIHVEICEHDTFTTPGHNSYRRNKTNIRNYNVFYPEHLWK